MLRMGWRTASVCDTAGAGYIAQHGGHGQGYCITHERDKKSNEMGLSFQKRESRGPTHIKVDCIAAHQSVQYGPLQQLLFLFFFFVFGLVIPASH